MYIALRAIDSLKVLLAPFVPFSAERLHQAFGYEHPLFGTQHIVTYAERERTHEALVYNAAHATGRWAPSTLASGQRLAWSQPLYKKIDTAADGIPTG